MIILWFGLILKSVYKTILDTKQISMRIYGNPSNFPQKKIMVMNFIKVELKFVLRLLITEIPPAYTYYCNNSLQCPAFHGFSRCVNHLCMCDENFYQVYNSTTGKTYCLLCSGKYIFIIIIMIFFYIYVSKEMPWFTSYIICTVIGNSEYKLQIKFPSIW